MHTAAITTQSPLKVYNCYNSLLPSAMKMIFTEKETDVVNKLTRAPLSNAALLKCISDMSINACEQLVLKSMESDYFAPYTDSSTDVSGCAQLLAFVKYILENTVNGSMLFCKTFLDGITEEGNFLKYCN